MLFSQLLGNLSTFTQSEQQTAVEQFASSKVFAIFAIIFILLINIPLLNNIFQKANFTFINKLITADCILCISNCIILFNIVLGGKKNSTICLMSPTFGYFVNILRRLLTIGIVVYRYVFVLKHSWVQTQDKRRNFCLGLAGAIISVSGFSTFLCILYRDQYLFYLGKKYRF